MPYPEISFEPFELPFARAYEEVNINDFEDSDDDPAWLQLLNFCLRLLPEGSLYIGDIESKAENGCLLFSDEYYIIRLDDDSDYDWALVLIRFAPEQYPKIMHCRFCARLLGYKYDAITAAKCLLEEYFERHHIDLKADDVLAPNSLE